MYGLFLTLHNYLNGSNPNNVIGTEKESENETNTVIRSNDDQKDPKRIGEVTKRNDLEAKKDLFECVFASTKNDGFEWEQNLLSLKINLEDRQTKLEEQIKSLQEQIDSTRNSQCLNTWLGDQVNKL